jgi:hypothetical protein
MENDIEVKLEKYDERDYSHLKVLASSKKFKIKSQFIGFIFYKTTIKYTQEYHEFTDIKFYIILLQKDYLDKFKDKINDKLLDRFPLNSYKHDISWGSVSFID